MPSQKTPKDPPSIAFKAALIGAFIAFAAIAALIAIASGPRGEPANRGDRAHDSAQKPNKVATSPIESLFESLFLNENASTSRDDQKIDPSEWVTADHPLASELTNRPPNFSDALALDDACLFHAIPEQSTIWRDYFSNTTFARDYSEYDDVISGFESARSRFGSFYLGLALAHWLENSQRANPYKKSYARAGRTLLALAREDQGNAAPAAWALIALEDALKENDPTMSISISELEEAKDYLNLATRFDSYSLEHLRNMASIDDSRAVSFLVRVEYHRQLAVPKWFELLNRLKSSSNVSLETRIRLAELIANTAKNASRPSTAYGYSPFELKFAEKLAENARSIPTAEDIDKSFPVHQLASSVEIVKRQDGPCAPPAKDPYRQSLLKHRQLLKEAGVELGLSF